MKMSTAFRILASVAALGFASSITGCGASDASAGGGSDLSSAADGGAGSGDGGALAFNANWLPQGVNRGGQVMSAPRIVPVVWASDADAATLAAFYEALPSSSYWSTITSEYGVGPLSTAPAVTVTDAPPATISSDALATWLGDQITRANSAFPAPDDNTIYLLLTPAGEGVVTNGVDLCAATGGLSTFGNGSDGAGTNFVYAVVPRCTDGMGKPGTPTGLDAITSESIFALVADAVGGGHVDTNPAYQGIDDNHLAWSFASPGVVGLNSLCSSRPWSYFRDPQANGMVIRMWSNKAAQVGDPCVPRLPGTQYQEAFASLTDKVSVTDPFNPNRTVQTPGVIVPVGQTKTVPFTVYAEPGNDGPISLTTYNISGTSNLTLTFDHPTANPGDVVNLSITRNAADAKATATAFGAVKGSLPYYYYMLVGQ